MTAPSQLLCVFYALGAIAALYGTQSGNLQYASTFSQFVTDLKTNLGHAGQRMTTLSTALHFTQRILPTVV